MTPQRGHATREEQEAVEELERQHRRGDPVDVVVLAQLYVDPLHEEDRALPLLRDAVVSDPTDVRARYWLAHCLIRHDLSDEALAEALMHLRLVKAGSMPWAAAGLVLEAGAYEWLHPEDIQLRVALLERAVALAPGWAAPRSVLAENYLLQGRKTQARRELEAALRNLASPPNPKDLADEYFHVNVTGLLDEPERVAARLAEIQGDICP